MSFFSPLGPFLWNPPCLHVNWYHCRPAAGKRLGNEWAPGPLAELPWEHIFTLVLFLRDQTWGKAELLAVPPPEHSSQPGREFSMVWLLVMCCALLSLPSPGRGWQYSPLSKQVASPSCVSFRLLPKYFCCIFNWQRLLLFPLTLYFFFKNNLFSSLSPKCCSCSVCVF